MLEPHSGIFFFSGGYDICIELSDQDKKHSGERTKRRRRRIFGQKFNPGIGDAIKVTDFQKR
jgi:hypothetical protein